MPDITIQIPVTIPDAYTPRALAWLAAKPPLMEPSGEVDEFGDPIMQEVSETPQEKFIRIVGDYAKRELRDSVLSYERRAATASVDTIEVN